MIGAIRRFYDGFFSPGDRLGEAFYGIWMAVVSIGLLNTGAAITPDHLLWVVLIAFSVNVTWGAIDGVTVMITNVIDRADRERLVHALRSRPRDMATRAATLAELDGTIAGSLDDAAKARLIEAIAAGPPGPDPAARRWHATREDWLYAGGIVAIDAAVVVPVVLPFALIPDVEIAVYVSRLVATAIFAAIGAAYARHLNRRPWVAAVLVGGLGFALATATYEAGW